MGVPPNMIARFSWRLEGEKPASGQVRVVGDGVTIDTGGNPGTEYWYVDARTDTGVASKFTLTVEELTDPRPGFVDPKDAMEAPLHPSSKEVEAQDLPEPGAVVGRRTPLSDDGPDHTALVWEIVSNPKQQKAPRWYWRPNQHPNLFGNLQAVYEQKLPFEMSAVDEQAEGFPKAQAVYRWRVATQ